jgi:hypothetical protein
MFAMYQYTILIIQCKDSHGIQRQQTTHSAVATPCAGRCTTTTALLYLSAAFNPVSVTMLLLLPLPLLLHVRRYTEVVGRGRFKQIYKAFDTQIGIDVAWSKITAEPHHLSDEQLQQIVGEMTKGLDLEHPNIIKCFECWEDQQRHCINLITELFTSGNLRQYRNLHKHLDLKVSFRFSFFQNHRAAATGAAAAGLAEATSSSNFTGSAIPDATQLVPSLAAGFFA